MAILVKVLGTIGMNLLTAFLAEKVLAKLMFGLMERFVKHTDNKMDDELVASVKESYYGEDK
jgi:hypothetical protein